mmetsp:Transcript_37030/g.76969  ORF Transcript_37030/g.76969 Transcript_37030/m.76969 type:complete len:266 (-) Transcript_37030:599-1396(-)
MVQPRPKRLLDCFVINLRDRTERFQIFQARAQGAGWEDAVERFEAVDTRTLSQLEHCRHMVEPQAYQRLISETMSKGHRRKHSDLTPGAVGCALSHIGVIRLAWHRKLPMVAVFEDDALLPSHTNSMIHHLLDNCLENHQREWDCLLLGWSGAPPVVDKSISTVQIQRVQKFWGMHAYLLSSSGISKMLQFTTRKRNSKKHNENYDTNEGDLIPVVSTHIDHCLSQEAQDNNFIIYGISQQEHRILQDGRGGSDIHLPLLPPDER